MNKTIEFTQEELIALVELVNEAVKDEADPIWPAIYKKIEKAAFNR